MAGETIFQALLVALALVLVQVIIGLIRSYRSKSNGTQDRFYEDLKRDKRELEKRVHDLELKVAALEARK